MTTYHAIRAPLLTDRDMVAALQRTRTAPVSSDEIQRLVCLAELRGARAVTLGHGPGEHAADAITRFGSAWTEHGGLIMDVVSWPDDAASWLRHARRLTAPRPDLWIMAGPALGFVQMARRLTVSTTWDPARTLAFSHVAHAAAVRAAGPGVLDGLCGSQSGLTDWRVEGGAVCLARPARRRAGGSR